MANVDTTLPVGQRNIDRTDPARVYEENAELLYAVARFFLPDAAAAEASEAVATDLFHVLPGAGYERYARLLCLRSAFTRICTDPRAKIPRDLKPNEVTIQEAFSLLLRDRFSLSCTEIAAIVGTSEGSVRTRLERSRLRLFSRESPPPRPQSPPSSQASHLCIRTAEMIEDWNIASVRLGQFTTPSTVVRAVGECSRCERVLTQRLTSLSHFHELHLPPIPERLRVFPVSPMFIKEGKRVLLNWSAAPWYVKALFEGLLATTLVLGIVLSIPRIKSIYEFWLERRLDLYSIAELAAGLGTGRSESSTENPATSNSTPATGSSGVLATRAGTSATGTNPGNESAQSAASEDSAAHIAVKSETEFVGREATIPSSDKIYRVLIKTDSPEAIKDQVMRLLANAHYNAADSDAPPGSELPGGVIFDVFVPFKGYKSLVDELEHIGDTRFIVTRSKERGVAGKAHLKIWLQRI